MLDQVALLNMENNLAKIVIQTDEKSFMKATERRVKVMCNEGIELYFPNDASKDS